MSWSLVALAVLSLTLAAMVRARGPRAQSTAHAVPRSASPSEPAEATERRAEAKAAPTRSCPVCLSEYPPQNRFCVRDGAPLSDGCTSGLFSQGMICPTCRRGYPSDASFCPEDADELVPYGLFGAASSTRPPIRLDGNKICPECGVRHAAVHLFCGHDGTELVIVN